MASHSTTHGLGVDQPLGLFGQQVVVPHANWRGMFDEGTCPTAMCDGSIGFPGKNASSYGATEPDGLRPWYGSLIAGMTDASGYLYRHNRYADPKTGRFTQEDPIGLAGGLNLYGFADGDPVSYSDPFGLCSVATAVGSVALGAGVAYLTGSEYGLKQVARDAVLGCVGVGGASKAATLFRYRRLAQAAANSLDEFSGAAAAAERGGFTRAGYELSKHMNSRRHGFQGQGKPGRTQ